MTTLFINTEDQKVLQAVKDLLKNAHVSFEEQAESPYNPEFIEKIKNGKKDIQDGKRVKITLDEIIYNSEFVAMIEDGEQQIKEGRTTELKEGENLWDLVTSK
ncbi:DUF2683 family protein [Dyadobacter chenhuakuii]|uniref:Uncharacterized protein n=1 Tax=Dyadobacter chenhuakuii TaxID=2909339 RepID=A0ABY4XLL4_9BACT|nr:DUF2683 family protein [Dyadobacter chenhuakuii]MCF2493753.1 hypothetical protein [Dyadobacter chenhuakuii]USJ30887.1 hypothetical protein NFI80_23890 [Dyadobacter chenhuakuii]